MAANLRQYRAAGRADDAGAPALAELLGWLPLALDHAAAFCNECGDSFAEYGRRVDAWLKEAPEGADYPAPVFATFKLAIERAAAACPEASTLMGILSFLAPDAIPRDIVTEDVLDAMALRRATAALSKVSLVKVAAEAEGGPLLSVHRLVQRVMRAQAAAGEAGEAATLALRLVADAFPRGDGSNAPSDVRCWPACARLYPHALAVLAAAIDPTTNTVMLAPPGSAMMRWMVWKTPSPTKPPCC